MNLRSGWWLLSLLLLAWMVWRIPAVPVSKDTSRPFPCMHRRCGCRSAEQCLQRCCCFSAAQRSAWFRAQRIAERPSPAPETASPSLTPLAGAALTVRERETIAADDRDTSGKARRSCCAAPKSSQRATPRASSSTSPRVVAVRAWGCAGEPPGPLTLIAATYGLNASPLCVQLDAPTGDWYLLCSERVLFRDEAPPVPPPERG